MSRNVISVILTVYFLSVLVAVLVRLDGFPWTWVPMYSAYVVKDHVTVPLRDKADLSSGLIATHRNGAESRVTARMLDIPSRNYWRIHLQRAAHQGAAKYAQARMNLSGLNQAIWGGQRDPANLEPVDWNRRVLESLNRTLGRCPSDPDFIVSAKAPATHVTFNKRTMEIVDVRRVAPEVRWSEA